MSCDLTKGESIPNEDYVFRHIHCAETKEWTNRRRRPNEGYFLLREGEGGLSVNWEKYCSLYTVFILIGVDKTKRGQFRTPSDFKVIKFNVGDLRKLSVSEDNKVEVVHDPDLLRGNMAHSLVCYNDYADDIRMKLCDLVESMETPLLTINFAEIQDELEARRKTIP